MSQDAIDATTSGVLLVAGAGAHLAPTVINADIYVNFAFHILSVISVAMVVVINRKKFISEVKTWFKK